MRYAFLPKKSPGGRVQIRATLQYGNSKSLFAFKGAALLLDSVLARGAEDLPYQEYTDRLNELGSSIRFWSGIGTLNVLIDCKQDNLDETLSIARQALREPAMRKEEFEIVKRQAIANMVAKEAIPQCMGQYTIWNKLSPYSKEDIRYEETINETLQLYENTSVEQVRALYREQLRGRSRRDFYRR